MFLIFSLLIRIKKPIGESNYIPRVNETELNKFLLSHELSVVFFADAKTRFDFANYAIKRHTPYISFVVATKDSSKSHQCDDSICIRAYRKSKPIDTVSPPHTAIGFEKWCYYLTTPHDVTLTHPDQLREIFTQHGNFVFGVDIHTRPEHLKGDFTYYAVPAYFFSYFKINVTSGLYIYRSADRQLVKITGNLKNYLKIPVVDINLVDLSKRKYFGGYFVSYNDEESNQMEIAILHTLASKYQTFYLSSIAGKIAEDISLKSLIHFVPPPFFAIFESSTVSKNRWIINDPTKIHDIVYLTQFLEDIESGKQPYTKLSGKPENCSFTPIEYNSFIDVVTKDNSDSIILYYSPYTSSCLKSSLIMEKIKSLLPNGYQLKIYLYDLTLNDLPDDFPPEDFPILVLYNKNKKQAPIPYDGEIGFEEILTFINEEASVPTKIDDYDLVTINKEISNEMQKSTQNKQK